MSACVEYVLDEEDRIVSVGGDWDEFARANGGEHLIGQALLGSSFWDHVSGESLSQLLGLVFRRVRQKGKPITVPSRCDSPQFIRHLEIRVRQCSDHRLEIQSCISSEVPRGNWRSSARSRMLLQMCSWCNRFHIEGQWLEIEDAIRRLKLADAEFVPRSSHGICPDCADLLKQSAIGLHASD
jgi:hypothetical protein